MPSRPPCKVISANRGLVGELFQCGYSVLGGRHPGDLSGKSLGAAPQLWLVEQTPQRGLDAVGGGVCTNQGNTGAGGVQAWALRNWSAP